MSGREHTYTVAVDWSGNRGEGTRSYTGYGRDHTVHANGPEPIAASSDPAFRGDADRWNPEQLFLASVAQCHMLWYLHLAQRAGIVVTSYRDEATAVMDEDDHGGGGVFGEVRLNPTVTIAAGDVAEADRLHDDVGAYCFVARSLAVPIVHTPRTTYAEARNRS